MTVPIETARITHTGNGALATYAYPFRIYDDDDLRCTRRSSGGIETLLTKSVDYTVAGVGGESGGTVSLLTGNLPTGEQLVIERIMEILQTTDLRNQGPFQPEMLESEYDRIVMRLQQVEALLRTRAPASSRVPALRVSDSPGSGVFQALGNRLGGLANPVDDQDAVTKAWLLGQDLGGGEVLGPFSSVGGLPAASANPWRFAVVKEAGVPEQIFVSLRNTAGTSYAWINFASGNLL